MFVPPISSIASSKNKESKTAKANKNDEKKSLMLKNKVLIVLD